MKMLDILTGKLTFKSLDTLNLETCTKQEIKDYFDNAYDLNESLFSSLTNEEVFYKCPDRVRMPLIFYYGHTASVYINKLVLSRLIKPNERINIKLETMFETGVNELKWDDIENYRLGNKYVWPTLSEVVDYRRKVRNLIYDVIERTPLTLPITWDNKWWAVILGIEHERVHFETSSVLIRQLPICMVNRPEGWVYGPSVIDKVLKSSFVEINEREVVLGKPKNDSEFGWDNEYGSLKIKVPTFEVSNYLATNEEFLEFVVDKGYETESYWTKEGWKWKTFQNAKHPTFWICDKKCKTRCGSNLDGYTHCSLENGEQYKFRCMFDNINMPSNWPVEVNQHEAKAFCKWKTTKRATDQYLYRLLSEAEYNIIRDNSNLKNGAKGNINLIYGSSTPVNMYPANDLKIYDAFGNVWQWLEDHFYEFPGFESHYLYHDYSYPYFEGLHTLIAGGSWVSNGTTTTPYIRFTFRRHFFQHLGFRLVKQKRADLTYLPIRVMPSLKLSENDYPFDDIDLNKMCLQLNPHKYPRFNDSQIFEPSQFTLDLAHLTAERAKKLCDNFSIKLGKLLLIGCEIGDIIFDFEDLFEKITGVDHSRSNIDYCVMRFNNYPNKMMKKSAVVFKQMSWLPNEVSFQDVVIFSIDNLIINPQAWCRRLLEIVNKNGLLVVVEKQMQNNSIHFRFISEDFTKVDEHVLPMKSNSVRITAWKHLGEKTQ